MSDYIIKRGSTLSLAEFDEVLDGKLRPGNYSLRENIGGFYLEEAPDFVFPPKLYGDFSVVDRYMHTWSETTRNLGILLAGQKGTGKTVTAQVLCQKLNLPVILITSPFVSDGFLSFLSKPQLQGSIVFIDEFEKLYSTREAQNCLLTLLDGIYSTNLLFLLTSNSADLQSDLLMNRLGRIRYSKTWANLPLDIVRDVAQDRLKNKNLVDDVLSFFSNSTLCTMDVVTALIDEMNRFDETSDEASFHLNLSQPRKLYNADVKFDFLTETLTYDRLYVSITSFFRGETLELQGSQLRMGFKGTSGRSLKEHKEVPGLTKHIFDEIEYMYLGKSELVSVTRDKIGRYLLKFNLQFELVAGNTTEHSVVVKLSPATHNQAATPQRALTFSSVDDLEDEE